MSSGHILLTIQHCAVSVAIGTSSACKAGPAARLLYDKAIAAAPGSLRTIFRL